jgi:hypothetical protein
MHVISWVVLGVAALQAVVAIGIAALPPPQSSEGGLLAGAMYMAYFVVPQLFLAWTLRSTLRSMLIVTTVVAASLTALYVIPMFVEPSLASSSWQAAVGQAMAAVTALVDAVVFVAALAALFQQPIDPAADALTN